MVIDEHESYRDEIVDTLMHTYTLKKVKTGVDVLLLRYSGMTRIRYGDMTFAFVLTIFLLFTLNIIFVCIRI